MQVLNDGELSSDSDEEEHNVWNKVLGVCLHFRVEPLSHIFHCPMFFMVFHVSICPFDFSLFSFSFFPLFFSVCLGRVCFGLGVLTAQNPAVGKAFTWRQHAHRAIPPHAWTKNTAQGVTSPGSRHGHVAKSTADEFDGARREGYRSIALTAHHVAADRQDLQYTTLVLVRTLETPLELQEFQLTRPANYFNAVLELWCDLGYQEVPDQVHLEVDSDRSRCPRTSCLVAGICWTAVVSSSSTRSHSAAPKWSCTRSCMERLSCPFVRNVLQSMDVVAHRRVGKHSCAASGITQWLGAGCVGHLEDLWVQEKVRSPELKVTSVHGEDNKADLWTKLLDPQMHHRLLELLPLCV